MEKKWFCIENKMKHKKLEYFYVPIYELSIYYGCCDYIMNVTINLLDYNKNALIKETSHGYLKHQIFSQ